MKNSRRSFFKLFGAAAAITAVAPSVLLPRAADAFRWKRAASGMWIVNPEWINAPLEIRFCWQPGDVVPFMVDRSWDKAGSFNPKPGTLFVPENFPMRNQIINPLTFSWDSR